MSDFTGRWFFVKELARAVDIYLYSIRENDSISLNNLILETVPDNTAFSFWENPDGTFDFLQGDTSLPEVSLRAACRNISFDEAARLFLREMYRITSSTGIGSYSEPEDIEPVKDFIECLPKILEEMSESKGKVLPKETVPQGKDDISFSGIGEEADSFTQRVIQYQ
jgi:hypothetical protein